MDEKVTLFLKNLTDRISDIETDYVTGTGKKLANMAINQKSFDNLDKKLSDANYCNMSDAPLPKGAAGLLWGIPFFIDDNLPDNQINFTLVF